MSFYEPQAWQQIPQRQASWEQAPPSRSGASSASQREDSIAFAMQFEEVDRAVDNLVKSGRFYTGPVPTRMPPMYAGHGSRGHSGRHSNFYAGQRYQGRPQEGDQMMQAKRRMAAQREKELRNYHQEQQYNRSVLAEMASNKSDRSMSPSTMSEEGRRDLIQRQRMALYSQEGQGYQHQQYHGQEQGQSQLQAGQHQGQAQGQMRGPSPGIQPFPQMQEGLQQQQQQPPPPQPQPSSIEKQPTPPNQQQALPQSQQSGDDSAHARTISKSTTAPVSGSMGPIGGIRGAPSHIPTGSVTKRATSPLTTLSPYGFGSIDAVQGSTSQPGNDRQKDNSNPGAPTWGTGSGVWGGKLPGSSVWN